jgi:hypothetical protein
VLGVSTVGGAGSFSAAHALAHAVARPASQAEAATVIVGGLRAQRVLLRQILATLAPAQLRRLRILRVHGGVKLRASVDAVRPTWKLLVAGAAFFDRSAARHLPPVLEVDARRASWPTSNAGRRPPPATPARVAATRRRMRRLARDSGARRFTLTISTPDAVAVSLRLRVSNAARFLDHRLRALVTHAQARESRYDGLLIEVDDRQGTAWADGETRLGGETYVRPDLAGCDPFPPPGPMPTPSPCPS